MNYQSTRQKNIFSGDLEAILMGLSPEGGLFEPHAIPKIKIKDIQQFNYRDLCQYILSLYFPSFSNSELEGIVHSAYSQFSKANAIGLESFGNVSILELFHGPTAAFKDFALQILPQLIIHAKKHLQDSKHTVVLTATSGDTGSAALEGFKGLENVDIFVFYPTEGISDIQKTQMTTVSESNVHVAGIKGNFDDAQLAVKSIFKNQNFKNHCESNHIALTSANSINIGRLIPQIVYYLYSYCQLIHDKKISEGMAINIAVPSGNFGNLLAAFYAKQMGLPVHRLICATNENDVLADFFSTGLYNSHRPFIQTSSPSMDILISSNLERLLCFFYGSDIVGPWMEDLQTHGAFSLSPDQLALLKDFIGCSVPMPQVLLTIKNFYKQHQYLLDPHSAIAVKSIIDYQQNTGDNHHCIVAATASPFKFAHTLLEALEIPIQADAFENIAALSLASKTPVPPLFSHLKKRSICHQDLLNPDEIEDYIKQKIY